MTRWILLGALFAACSLGASPALAEDGGSPEAQARDDEMARKLFETGRAYFERAKYDDAAEAFGEAFRLSGRTTLLVNQARALESAGRVHDAMAALERFIELEQNDAAARESVGSMLRRLRAEAARIEAARLEASAEETAEPSPNEGEATEEVAPAAGLERAERRRGGKIAGLSAIAFGGASGIIAFATGLSGRQKMNSLEEQCPMSVCPPALEGEIDRGHRLSVTSTVFTFVGVAAAASGVLVLVLTRDSDLDPEATRVEVAPGPAARGASLRVTF